MDIIQNLTDKFQQMILSKENTQIIAKKLEEFGITHLLQQIKPIIYSSSC